MADDKSKTVHQVAAETDGDYDAMDQGRKGFFGRFNARLNDALQQGRAAERPRDGEFEHSAAPTGHSAPTTPAPAHADAHGDDLALRKAKSMGVGRMVVPEGVVIEGSLTGSADTEIHGRITGDISIEGRIYLGPKAIISGNVKATACQIEGNVEGKVECSDEVQLGATGRLHADVLAGKRIFLAGQVYGNVATPGMLKLASTCRVDGDVRARNLTMDEGAALNGKCIMRAPTQQQQAPAQQAQGGQKK